MQRKIDKMLLSLDKKEVKLLTSAKKDSRLKEKIYEKIPASLRNTLEDAFIKAFKVVFVKGTSAIEKTFHKEDTSLEFEANNYILDRKLTKKTLNRLDKQSQKSNLLNSAITTTSGIGFGILGIGLPDIPILAATILKGMYQIALSYGFSYETDGDKIYILRLIRLALCKTEDKEALNSLLDDMNYDNTSLDREITLTAKFLSDALLVEKFVQGIPIVGVIGGFVNHIVYQKIVKLSVVKYKKRYLILKNR